jgi:hypothetical protein
MANNNIGVADLSYIDSQAEKAKQKTKRLSMQKIHLRRSHENISERELTQIQSVIINLPLSAKNTLLWEFIQERPELMMELLNLWGKKNELWTKVS